MCWLLRLTPGKSSDPFQWPGIHGNVKSVQLPFRARPRKRRAQATVASERMQARNYEQAKLRCQPRKGVFAMTGAEDRDARTILVVDDAQDILILLKLMLETHGYRALLAPGA